VCPGGTYGATPRLTTSTCSGRCAGGYYCPPQSTDVQQAACGGPDVYCPEGSAAPVTVPEGEFSVGASASTANASLPCAAGHYCSLGVQRECPAGTFGCSIRLKTRLCSGNCSAGYFCPQGSMVPNPVPCGAGAPSSAPAAVYCPAGSAEPANVSSGFFTVGGLPDTRSGQQLCPSGAFCVLGVQVSLGRVVQAAVFVVSLLCPTLFVCLRSVRARCTIVTACRARVAV
jgi:hypothetical protein